MSIRHTLFLFMLISAPVAGAANGMHDKLIRIEREMDSGKEIVTSRLDEIDRNLLKSRNDKALYSLLRTLCLDEAGVEIASDSLISTAASYYQRHGSPDHKMKTFYCRGRIEENSSNSSAAMEWYSKAEDLLEKTGDFRIGGKVFQRKAELYKGLFDYRDALMKYRNASDCFINNVNSMNCN